MWEAPSDQLAACAQRIGTVWAALEPLLYGGSNNVSQILYNEVNSLKTVEAELSQTRAQIDRLANEGDRGFSARTPLPRQQHLESM